MKLKIYRYTPLRIDNFEAKHHPIIIYPLPFLGSMLIFQEVSKIAMVWNKDQNDVGVCQYVKQNSSQESRRSRWRAGDVLASAGPMQSKF